MTAPARLPVGAIRVGERARTDLGDLASLAESIERVGLIHPIAVTPDGRLIAGFRRLEACKLLGWAEVPVHVLSALDSARAQLIAERDENTCRLDMSPAEKVRLGRRLEELERPKARQRQGRPGKPRSVKVTEHTRPQVRDLVASAVGMSGPTYQRAKRVIEAADQPDAPDHVKQAAADLEAGGAVATAYNKAFPDPPKPSGPQLGVNRKWPATRREPRQIIQAAIHQIAATADALALVDFTRISSSEASGFAAQLTDPLRSLRRVHRCLKEEAQQ